MTFLGVDAIFYSLEMLVKKNMFFERLSVSAREFNILGGKNLEAKYYTIVGNQ